MGRLDGKVALITGSGRGIGRAAALLFAKEGAAVVVNDIDPDVAQQTAQEIRNAGGKAISIAANVADPADAQRLIDEAVKQFGKLDILVNNAGLTRDAMVHKMSDEFWKLVWDVNLRAAFYCTKAALKYMLKEEAKKSPVPVAKIINVSSLSGVMGNVGQFNYSSAKSALIGLTKSLARELAPYRINVNGVAYGLVETRLTAEKKEGDVIGIPKPLRDAAIAMQPWRRAATPEEAAGPILFLASSESDIINGHVIYCAGGGSVA